VLQPELEANVYGRRDAENGIGSGLSEGRMAIRLRYEIRRELAPYLGIVHTRRFGDTANMTNEDAGDTQLVAGLRFWF